MSRCDVQVSAAIELYFYGELAVDQRLSIEQHVRACAECRRALDDLSTIRAALASRPDVAAPPGGDWSGFMVRLNEALRRDVAPAKRRRSILAFSPRTVVPYFAAAAVLVLVTISVAVLVRHPSSVQPAIARDPSITTVGPGPTEVVDDPALTALSEQHFERSKLVVLGLATKDPADLVASDWTYERELAGSLLSDTRLYRLAAEERGMKGLAGVMRDLELVLLEASMSEQPDSASLEQLQRLIRRRDLVTKMNVVETAGL